MSYETIFYKGMEIDIDHHQDAEDPFTAWDCNLPLMYKSGNNNKDYSDGDIGRYVSELLTDNQIIRHQKKIAEWFDIDLDYFKDYEFSKEDKIDEIRSEIESNTNLARFVYICELAKEPHLCTSSHGYSQGDYAEIFVIATDTWRKEVGNANIMTEEQLQEAVDLWSSWAWGDVYGYYIPELEDSCWGYYGNDFEKSGLLEEARSVIDYEIEKRKENRFRRLKQFIKNRVPYHIRGIRLNHECFKLI